MSAITYLTEKGRMTKNCAIHCADCPLGNNNRGVKELSCNRFECTYSDRAVAIVENWSRKNPVFSEDEIITLKFLRLSGYKWMTRDGLCDDLCAYNLKPIRNDRNETWLESDIDDKCIILDRPDLFRFITWLDEPQGIEELLKKAE